MYITSPRSEMTSQRIFKNREWKNLSNSNYLLFNNQNRIGQIRTTFMLKYIDLQTIVLENRKNCFFFFLIIVHPILFYESIMKSILQVVYNITLSQQSSDSLSLAIQYKYQCTMATSKPVYPNILKGKEFCYSGFI